MVLQYIAGCIHVTGKCVPISGNDSPHHSSSLRLMVLHCFLSSLTYVLVTIALVRHHVLRLRRHGVSYPYNFVHRYRSGNGWVHHLCSLHGGHEIPPHRQDHRRRGREDLVFVRFQVRCHYPLSIHALSSPFLPDLLFCPGKFAASARSGRSVKKELAWRILRF